MCSVGYKEKEMESDMEAMKRRKNTLIGKRYYQKI